MNDEEKKYCRILEISRKARVLSGISSLLEWDQETYMPSGAGEIRAEQLELVAGLIHKEKTGRTFRTALSKLIHIDSGKIFAKSLSFQQKAALREWRRDFIQASKLPSKFVKEFAALSAQSMQAWERAKKDDAFSHFAPFLDRFVGMCRKKAEYLGYDEHPYDALLDLYEPDMKASKVSKLFNKLKKPIMDLFCQIKSAKENDKHFLHGKFSHAKQIAFGKDLLRSMRYSLKTGRLDLSTHPFSTSCHPTDNRITTRIHSTSLMSNILAILHEGGHALYEMGLPKEHYGSPLCEAISFGIHESQSRWWETLIGQSRSFWKFFFPDLKKTFKGNLENIHLEQFYRGINHVEPSLIRLEADEVSYTIHIIIRFELELSLMEGSLSVCDIPEAWNEKMLEYLGIQANNDAEGCLQDIHWSMGAFGYFPSYALGNLYSAQFFTRFEKIYPDWQQKVERGDLSFIQKWLYENIHRHGRVYSAKDLLKKITGGQLSAKPYISYLQSKYGEIYSLK